MLPRWVRRNVAFSSIMIFLIIASFLMTTDIASKPRKPTKPPSILLARMKRAILNKSLPTANVLDVRKPEDQTQINLNGMVPVFQSLENPGPARLTVAQYLKRLGQDDLNAVPLSSIIDDSTVVLDIDKAPVPNVVHYINFKAPGFTFGFTRYVAFFSVYKYIKPGLTIVWGDDLPDNTTNEWWARTLQEFPNIYYVLENPVTTIGGRTVTFVQHKSDWLRMRILIDYGGIYLDHDVFALRPFADLLKYPLTLGRETPDSVSPGIILSAPEQEFLKRWQRLYNSQYKPDSYSLNSNRVLGALAKSDVDLVHILNGSFTDPYPLFNRKGYVLFCGNYDITSNYAVHIYRATDFASAIPMSEEELAAFNCTLGNAMRTVLYDDPKVRSKRLADGCVTKY